MNSTIKKLLYWLPRILALLFIGFISIFAFDVFAEPQWPIALGMHLIPSVILLLLTVISWKHARVGGVLFLIASIAMAMFFHSIGIAAPAAVIGVLFFMQTLLT